MLHLWGRGSCPDCEGVNRREFLKVGALGLTGLSLSGLLRLRQAAAASGGQTTDTSVIWLWLGGGATHIETFDPKPDAPAEFRSMVGAVQTALPGVQIGGLFPEMAKSARRMAFVRSFMHGSSGHSNGTHFVMTGAENPQADNGATPARPSIGSIAAHARGTNSPRSGVPTYVRLSNIYADGPYWLGPAYAPFDVAGQARNDLTLRVPLERLNDRRQLLKTFDAVDRGIDQSGLMAGLDAFDQQAMSLILGKAKDAFDVGKEDAKVCARYKQGTATLGERLLLARRLCEAGCGFVTLSYANSPQNWDMHANMLPQLKQACPPLDRAVSVFLDDVAQRGLSEKILLVITGDFGRTPRINRNGGRDHWGNLCTLALAGGGLKMGQVVGESSSRAEFPKSRPIQPKDLMATIFRVLGVDGEQQVRDPSGRPQYLLPEGAQPIAELI